MLYIKTAKIKNSYDQECARNKHQIPSYMHKTYKMYKSFTKSKFKRDWNLWCIFFVHSNNVQTIQDLWY